jgi:hypothetical protein
MCLISSSYNEAAAASIDPRAPLVSGQHSAHLCRSLLLWPPSSAFHRFALCSFLPRSLPTAQTHIFRLQVRFSASTVPPIFGGFSSSPSPLTPSSSTKSAVGRPSGSRWLSVWPPPPPSRRLDSDRSSASPASNQPLSFPSRPSLYLENL